MLCGAAAAGSFSAVDEHIREHGDESSPSCTSPPRGEMDAFYQRHRINSACVAGVHTPAKPVCGRHVHVWLGSMRPRSQWVGDMLLVQWCYKPVLNCLISVIININGAAGRRARSRRSGLCGPTPCRRRTRSPRGS